MTVPVRFLLQTLQRSILEFANPLVKVLDTRITQTVD